MLGFGFGAGETCDEDGDKENQPKSQTSTPPWLKRQKVTEDSSHSNLVKSIR